MTPSVPLAWRTCDTALLPEGLGVAGAPRRRWSRSVAGSLAVATVVLGAAGPAVAQGPEPYRDPPFACAVHDYGTEPPSVPGPADDPLCVRYDKTNITVSTLEVVDFLAAEPGRVAIVAVKCSYWQQDLWVVRVAPDTPPLVEWEGSYWYDARTGAAAGILRDLHVAGQPADAATFIQALRPLVGDTTADQLAPYASAGGGGGLAFQLPDGFAADQQCGPATPDPAPVTEPVTPTSEPGPAKASPTADVGGDVSARQRLPATGGTSSAAPPVAFAAGGLALAAARRVRGGAAGAPWTRRRGGPTG